MQNRFCILLLLITANSFGQTVPPEPEPEMPKQDFGDWRARLANSGEAEKARIEMRKYGWQLLNAVMKNVLTGDQYRPLFYTWCTKAEVFVLNAPCEAPRSRKPRLVSVQRRTSSRTPIEAILSSSYFSPALVRGLRKAGLSQLPLTASVFENLPEESIVVKPYWQLVTCEDEKPTVSAWNGKLPARNKILAEPHFQSFQISASSLKSTLCQPPAASFEAPPVQGELALDDLFYAQIRDDTEAITDIEGDISNRVKGDYMVVVGLHIATRRQKDWVWATYWLAPPEVAKHEYIMERVKDRPQADGSLGARKASKFAMDMQILRGKTPVFNPYLEGRFPQGTKSNCIACHARAAVRSTPDGPDCPKASGTERVSAASGYVPTGFLWSIAHKFCGAN